MARTYEEIIAELDAKEAKVAAPAAPSVPASATGAVQTKYGAVRVAPPAATTAPKSVAPPAPTVTRAPKPVTPKVEKVAAPKPSKVEAPKPTLELPPDVARPVDYKKFYDNATSPLPESSIRLGAAAIGMSEADLKRVAQAQGVDLEAVVKARTKGRTFDEIARASKERGVIGFMTPEERTAAFNKLAEDVEKAQKGDAGDTVDLVRSGADRGIGPAGALAGYTFAGTEAELPEVTKPGEHGYAVAQLLVESLAKDPSAVRAFDLYGRSLATGGTQQYIEQRVNDLRKRANIKASDPDAMEKMAALRKRAINEVIAYKTVGQWTPVVTLGDIEVREGRATPGFIDALKPNIEIIGFNNKRQAVFRQESPMGVLFRAIDIPQAAVTGILSGQGAAAGVQTGANLLEYALDATKEASTPMKVLGTAAGFAGSIIFPDMLAAGGLASKAAKSIRTTLKARKIAPEALDLLKTIAEARKRGDYATAVTAERKLRDSLPATASTHDSFDAATARFLELSDPDTDIMHTDLAALLGNAVPDAAKEAATRSFLHPSARKDVLSARAGGSDMPVTTFDELYDTQRLLDRMEVAKADYIKRQSSGRTLPQYAKDYVRGTVRDILANAPAAETISAADIDRMADIVADKAPLALLDAKQFRKAMRDALNADAAFSTEAFKPVRERIYKNGATRIERKMADIRGKTIQEIEAPDVALFDRALAAIKRNSDARGIAAQMLHDEIASTAKLRVEPLNLFDEIAPKLDNGDPIRLSPGGLLLLHNLRKAFPSQSLREAYATITMIDRMIAGAAKARDVSPFALYQEIFPAIRRGTPEDLKRLLGELKTGGPKGGAPAAPTPTRAQTARAEAQLRELMRRLDNAELDEIEALLREDGVDEGEAYALGAIKREKARRAREAQKDAERIAQLEAELEQAVQSGDEFQQGALEMEIENLRRTARPAPTPTTADLEAAARRVEAPPAAVVEAPAEAAPVARAAEAPTPPTPTVAAPAASPSIPAAVEAQPTGAKIRGGKRAKAAKPEAAPVEPPKVEAPVEKAPVTPTSVAEDMRRAADERVAQTEAKLAERPDLAAQIEAARDLNWSEQGGKFVAQSGPFSFTISPFKSRSKKNPIYYNLNVNVPGSRVARGQFIGVFKSLDEAKAGVVKNRIALADAVLDAEAATAARKASAEFAASEAARLKAQEAAAQRAPDAAQAATEAATKRRALQATMEEIEDLGVERVPSDQSLPDEMLKRLDDGEWVDPRLTSEKFRGLELITSARKGRSAMEMLDLIERAKGDLAVAVREIADTTTVPEFKLVAQRILVLEDEVRQSPLRLIRPGDPAAQSGMQAGGVGWYSSVDNTVNIFGPEYASYGLSEETLLHETLHALTHKRLTPKDAFSFTERAPLTKESRAALEEGKRAIKQVHADLVSHIRRVVADGTATPFEKSVAMSDYLLSYSPDELISWGLTDAGFQNYLKTVKLPKQAATLWQKFVRAMGTLLGFDVEETSALARVIEATDQLLAAKYEFVPDATTELARSASMYANDLNTATYDAIWWQAGRLLRRATRRGEALGFTEEDLRRALDASLNVPGSLAAFSAIQQRASSPFRVAILHGDIAEARRIVEMVDSVQEAALEAALKELPDAALVPSRRNEPSTTLHATLRAGFREVTKRATERLEKVLSDLERASAQAQKVEAPKPEAAPKLFPSIEPARRQTDTPEFKQWFGDSKVVDKKGKPRVMYHGTHGDFDVFDTSGTRRGRSFGAMFTPSKAYAASYGRKEYGGKVLSVYLRIENPFDAKIKKHAREWEANRLPQEGWVQYAHRAGYDGAITMLNEYVVFDPTQIKSATANVGTFDPNDPSILRSVEPLAQSAKSPWGDAPKRFVVAAESRLRKAGEDLDAGRINQAEYEVRVRDVSENLAAQKAERAAKKSQAQLVRGADDARARLLQAKAAGVIDEAGADLAEWLIRQNPRIADDLNIAVLTAESAKKRFGAQIGKEVAGFYEPVDRVVALIKERGSELTAAHEILHHTEQMLPPALQTAVVDEWAKQIQKALRTATPEQRPALEKALTGNATVLLKGITDGTLPRSFYQYSNPSEFWAVNASRIVSGRYATADKGFVAKAKRWLTEFVEKVKSAFGLTSDAPLIRGLDAVLKGEGTFVSEEMLSQGDIYRSIETQAPVPSGIPATRAVQTETPEFKRWFGDSKVVDAEGKPLVVYHGTATPTFEAFSFHHGINAPVPNAAYFGDNPAVANDAAGYGPGRAIYPVYLRMLRPLVIDAQGAHAIHLTERVVSALSRGRYDGVILENVREYFSEAPSTTYAVFDPTQIKSATGNVGTFSQTDPSILKQVSPAGQVKGLVETLDDGASIIYLFEGADASTVLHEVAHVVRRNLLSNDEMGLLASWAQGLGANVGHQYGEFTGDAADVEKAEEFFAKAFEQYVMEGKAPDAGLASVFEQLKQAVADVYKGVKDPVIGVELQPEVRQVFDRLLATTPETANDSLAQAIRRGILGGTDKETRIFDVLAAEAKRKGLTDKTVDELIEQFNEAKSIIRAAGGKVKDTDTALVFQTPVLGKKRWTFGDLVEAQVSREERMRAPVEARAELLLDLSGRGRGKSALIKEDSAVESLWSAIAAREGDAPMKAQAKSTLRSVASLFFGGDIVAGRASSPEAAEALRNSPVEFRRALDAAGSVVEQGVADTVSLMNDAIEQGNDDTFMRFLIGEADVRRRDGRPIFSAGHDKMGAFNRMVTRAINRLTPEERDALAEMADAFNTKDASLRGQKLSAIGFELKEGEEFKAADKRAEETRNLIASAVGKLLYPASAKDADFGSSLATAIRNAVGAGPQARTSHEWRLVETLTYIGGITQRNGALFKGDSRKMASTLFNDVKTTYKSDEAARRVAILVGAFGGADQAKNMLARVGLAAEAKTERAFANFLVGEQIGAENIQAVEQMMNKFGFNVNLVPDAVLGINLYIPREARERMAAALTRATFRPSKEITAGNAFEAAFRYMKLRMTRGSFVIRQRYFFTNTVDHYNAMAYTAGFGIASASTARVLMQDIMVLPAWREAIDLIRKTPAAGPLSKAPVIGPAFSADAMEQARAKLQKGGDKLAFGIGKMMGVSKYRIEVNPILEGVGGGFTVGGKVYRYRDIRDIAVEEGVFASFDTRELKRAVLREGQFVMTTAQSGGLAVAGKSTGFTTLKNFVADMERSVTDISEAWSERERLGAMVTLMEAGYDPRTAARITTQALFNYSQSMTKADRSLLIGMFLPFWAFQKNANRQVFDLLFSPWGAYRMMAVKRMRERSADLATHIWYNTLVDEYGVDVESMPPELQDSYYAIVKSFEESYGEAGPTPEQKRALRMLLSGRAMDVEAGVTMMASADIQRLRNVGAFTEIERFAPYAVAEPSPTERNSYFRDRAGVAIPFPRNEGVRIYNSLLSDNHAYMEIFWPDSTIEAGMKWHTQVAAAMILTAAKGADVFTPVDFKEGGIEEVSVMNVIKPILDPERAPIVSAVLAGDYMSPSPRRLAAAMSPEGARMVHPMLGKMMDDLYGTSFLRVPAAVDPFLVNDDGTAIETLPEEMQAQIKRLQEQYPDAGVLRDQRYYIPGGVWATAFDTSPLGELNTLLLRWEREPLERVAIQGEITRWARAAVGADVTLTAPSRAVRYEEPKKKTTTAGTQTF